MKIEIIEGSTEARVVDRFGLRTRHFVRTNRGLWVGDDGGWAGRELAVRLEEMVLRSDALVQSRERLERDYERAFRGQA